MDQYDDVRRAGLEDLAGVVRLGNSLLDKREIDQAEAIFEALKERFPDELRVDMGLARVAHLREDWPQALERWAKVMQRSPKNVNARFQYAMVLLNSGRIEAAEERFSELVGNFPDAHSGYIGLARVAQYRQDWILALGHWEKVISVIQFAPENMNAKAQRANMLLNISQIEEAEEAFQELVANSPEAVQGHAGLMRVGKLKADWNVALKAAQSVLERSQPSQPLFAQAAQTMILAQLRLNRFAEAEETVKRFQESGLSDEDNFLLTVSFLQEQGRWIECLAWFRKHEGIVYANPQLVLRYLEILLRYGEGSGAYRCLKEYLRTKPLLVIGHRLQIISILERMGKDKLAFRWLSLLVRKEGPGILNGDKLILLSAAFLKEREYDRFHSLAERIMENETLSPNPVVCRFTALFFKELASHLDEHHMIARVARSDRKTAPAAQLLDQLKEQVDGADNETSCRQTRLAFDEFARSYGRLEERFPKNHFLVNTFINPWECYSLVDFLIDRIQRREPTALIRLGEGEGTFLPYPEPYQSRQSGDCATMISHWWETILDVEHTNRIGAELKRAIDGADIIGIPEPAHLFLDMLPIPTPRDLSAVSMQWRGVLSIFHYLTKRLGQNENGFLPPRFLTASFVNYDLELWSGYDLIMQTAGTCSVICSHPDIAAALRECFQVEVRQVLLIPPERKYTHRASHVSEESHFPESFEHLADTLTVLEKGELFLVAAGILGKSYCFWIKERGGIALDVGSMADYWCGARTRRNSMHVRATIGQSIRRQAMEGRFPSPNILFPGLPTPTPVDSDKSLDHSLEKLQNDPAHQADPFIAPQATLDSCDSYIVRKGIKESLFQHLPFFTGTLLDVGCGRMPYKDFVLAKNPGVNRYIGLDFPSGSYADIAKPDIAWDGSRIPLGDACIDCVTATEVLEHCPEPLPILKEIRRVLKPDGVFFFTTPFLWPLHDVPHDHYRYTPYSLERLLCEAGFEDIQIRSTGGWDASLAQMIGLWLKRAPMEDDRRRRMTRALFPIYQYLTDSEDAVSQSFGSNDISPGWSGMAYRPLQYPPEAELDMPSGANLPKVCLVRSVSSAYSETFIDDHIAYLSNDVQVVHGRPLPMYDLKGDTVLEPEVFETIRRTRRQEDKQALYTEALAGYLEKSGFDVVLAEYGTNGAKVYKACEQAGVPCVVHFHGYDASKQSILREFEKEYQQMFDSAASLIVVSRAMLEKLVTLGAPREKIVLNPCGVSVARHDLACPEQSPPVFLSVGRFVEKKAPNLTIRAFSRMAGKAPDSRLVMAGDGPLFSICRKLALHLGIQEQVIFTGVQSRRSVAKLMRLSRAFVQHSITAPNGDSEGLPVAVMEAGAAGLPVISTRHAGIPDAVVHGTHGFLVEEKDEEAMAEAMRTLATDPELAGQMGRRYRDRIAMSFSRKRSITGLRQVINNVLFAPSKRKEG